MQLATGTVVGGKIVVEGEPLPEGAVVTILAREADETFEVPPELEAELLESIAEADRGETISADELIERLRRIPVRASDRSEDPGDRTPDPSLQAA